MKLTNEMEVDTAILHQPITIPMLGVSGTTLNAAKLKGQFSGSKFMFCPQGLHISNKQGDWIIPHAAIGSYLLKKPKDTETQSKK